MLCLKDHLNESTKETNSDLLLHVPAILQTQKNTDVSMPISGISAKLKSSVHSVWKKRILDPMAS